MKTATVTDFRSNMKEHLQQIEADRDILIVSGPKKKEFVVLTLEQYNSMEETSYLMSTTANTQRLMESIAQHKAGNIIVAPLPLAKRITKGKRSVSIKRERK